MFGSSFTEKNQNQNQQTENNKMTEIVWKQEVSLHVFVTLLK